MNDLFLLVLSRSVAVLPLIGAVMALRLALKSVPRWTVCLLWALVGLRLVCPSFPESPFSVASDAAGGYRRQQQLCAFRRRRNPGLERYPGSRSRLALAGRHGRNPLVGRR